MSTVMRRARPRPWHATAPFIRGLALISAALLVVTACQASVQGYVTNSFAEAQKEAPFTILVPDLEQLVVFSRQSLSPGRPLPTPELKITGTKQRYQQPPNADAILIQYRIPGTVIFLFLSETNFPDTLRDFPQGVVPRGSSEIMVKEVHVFHRILWTADLRTDEYLFVCGGVEVDLRLDSASFEVGAQLIESMLPPKCE